MRRLTLLATAATLLSLPALAQTMSRPADPAMQEMQREQMNPRTPYVPQQNRLRDQADEEGMQRPSQWVRQARQALAAGRLGQANELVERAETRILTRGTFSAQADQPMQDPALSRLSAAREALARQDRAGARRQLDAALAVMTSGGETRSMGDAEMDEAPARPMRRHYMRDGSRSALDAPIVLAQAGGGGGASGGENAGGLGGSTPGSPGTGQIGSTPSVLPGTAVQPGQGSASPGVRNREVGAPLPGTTPNDPVNQRGNTGSMPGSRSMGTGSQR